MDEFEKEARQLIKEYDEDTRNHTQKNKYYFGKLCDLFNDYYRKYEATVVLIDEGDEHLPSFKVDMPWMFHEKENHYRDIHTNVNDFKTAVIYLIARGQIFNLIKGRFEE